MNSRFVCSPYHGRRDSFRGPIGEFSATGKPHQRYYSLPVTVLLENLSSHVSISSSYILSTNNVSSTHAHPSLRNITSSIFPGSYLGFAKHSEHFHLCSPGEHSAASLPSSSLRPLALCRRGSLTQPRQSQAGLALQMR
jgi:hypothetical protein